MNRERVIEDAIIKSPGALGYPDALAIRNIRLDTNKESGRLDVLLLPRSGPHKLVLVETKVSTAADADGKCVGQLLKYFSFALRIGSRGRERLVEYATNYPLDAHAERPTTPKRMLGLRHESHGTLLLGEGDPITPQEIGLFIAIDGKCHGALPVVTGTLSRHFGLQIGIAIVENGDVRLDRRP